MHSRQFGKSILQGMDFSNIERRAMALVNNDMEAHLSAMNIVSRKEHDDKIDVAMNGVILSDLLGKSAYSMWKDDPYVLRVELDCKAKVFNLIDRFWSNPYLGLYGQMINQLDKNPKTRDIFKGKSTTHHYPWYKRDSKY